MPGPAGDPEIRVDPLTGLKVLVAGGRAGRPGGLPRVEPPPPIDPANDPFAEGNESRTPPELWADRDSGAPDTPGWRVRAVPNLYPALVESGDTAAGPADPLDASRQMPPMFSARPAVGSHEVIVNAPEPVASLADLPAEQLARAVAGWRARMRAHAAEPGIAYVHLCLNEGAAAGASLPHTHAQLYALPFVPAAIARERERARAYFEHTQGRRLIEDLVGEEVRAGDRLVAVDDEAVLIAPFAARTPHQLMLAPRRPAARFEDDGAVGAALLHDALQRLTRAFGATPPLNLWVRTATGGGDDGCCWRIDILPRLGQPAGMELGTGVHVNAVPPEQAATTLRDA